WVTAEYGMLPRSTHTRSGREAAAGRQSGRSQEIQRLIGRSLRAVFDRKALGERTLTLDCDVLQADGGTPWAAITGAFVAAADAVAGLRAAGLLEGDPIRDHVAAVSVGLYRGEPVLDLDYDEDSDCDADCNVVMTGVGGIVEVQGTAEGDHPFSRAQLDRLLDYAASGIARLVEIQRDALASPRPASTNAPARWSPVSGSCWHRAMPASSPSCARCSPRSGWSSSRRASSASPRQRSPGRASSRTRSPR